ncbi:MAG: DsbA family protein [Pseudomonadota bacterium]
MLTVYIDFKSPAAYLAMKPTLALAKRHAVEIDWRPFRTVERDIPKLGKEETVGESHRRVRAAALRDQAIKYARHQGIELQYPPELGSTDLALGVLANGRGDALPFIAAAFGAYWQDHANLDDPAVVEGLLDRLERPMTFAPEALSVALDQALEHADEIGIVGAPGYVIDDQIFVGREHLPWIEDIIVNKLTSRT